MAKTYHLKFDGYWSDPNKNKLPGCAGVYVVSKGSLLESGKVEIEEIIYIEAAQNVYARHNDKEHEHYKDFIRVCGGVEYVWYSCAQISGGESERKRVENALIYRLQPVINDKGKDSFSFPDTTIYTEGENVGILKFFTV